jgi:hypothetical protein
MGPGLDAPTRGRARSAAQLTVPRSHHAAIAIQVPAPLPRGVMQLEFAGAVARVRLGVAWYKRVTESEGADVSLDPIYVTQPTQF